MVSATIPMGTTPGTRIGRERTGRDVHGSTAHALPQRWGFAFSGNGNSTSMLDDSPGSVSNYVGRDEEEDGGVLVARLDCLARLI